MPTYRFQEVARTVKRSVKCRTCSKKFSRQTTFMQTINPFNRNRNADGEPKTYGEIWRELGVQCDAWQPDDECGRCRDNRIEDERKP